MKQTHIIAIVIVAIAIFIIISTAGSTSQYLTFDDIKAKTLSGDDAKYHVIGTLPRDINGDVSGIEYQPTIDPNYLAFNLLDETGHKERVICYSPPAGIQDFTKSEQVVIIGRFKNQEFIADEILLKCPSKYEEKEL